MTTIQPAVPIYEKAALTLEEAAAFSNIGINKLREITNERNCDFVFFVSNKRLIKRKRFEQYLDRVFLCESSKKLCFSSSIHLFRDDRFACDMIYYLCHTKALCPVEQKGDWHGYKMQRFQEKRSQGSHFENRREPTRRFDLPVPMNPKNVQYLMGTQASTSP